MASFVFELKSRDKEVNSKPEVVRYVSPFTTHFTVDSQWIPAAERQAFAMPKTPKLQKRNGAAQRRCDEACIRTTGEAIRQIGPNRKRGRCGVLQRLGERGSDEFKLGHLLGSGWVDEHDSLAISGFSLLGCFPDRLGSVHEAPRRQMEQGKTSREQERRAEICWLVAAVSIMLR